MFQIETRSLSRCAVLINMTQKAVPLTAVNIWRVVLYSVAQSVLYSESFVVNLHNLQAIQFMINLSSTYNVAEEHKKSGSTYVPPCTSRNGANDVS